MKTTTLRVICLAATLIASANFVVPGTREPTDAGQGHLSGLTARIIMVDGSVRVAGLEGVGCSAGICSRTLIKGRAGREKPVKVWLDSIAAIRDTTMDDALFVLKDGTTRRLSLVTDFRVLYVANPLGARERIDLARVKSIEFLRTGSFPWD